MVIVFLIAVGEWVHVGVVEQAVVSVAPREVLQNEICVVQNPVWITVGSVLLGYNLRDINGVYYSVECQESAKGS